MVQPIENKYINYNPSELMPRSFNHPVFILGLMRSGTTLLLNILTEHPQLLKIGVELNSIWTTIGGASCIGECHYKTAADFKPEFGINMTNYFNDNIEAYKSKRQLIKRVLFSQKFGSGGILKDWDQIIPVNKSPHLTNKSLYLHEMFPEARFIHIVRSIQSHSLSMKLHFNKDFKSRNMLNFLPEDDGSCWTRLPAKELENAKSDRLYPGNFKLIPEAWLKLNYQAIKDFDKIGKEYYRIYSYEDLIAKPEEILPDIVDFLRLDQKHQQKVVKMTSRQRKAFNTHTKDPINDWKTKLSEDEQMQIAKLIESQSEKYNLIQKTINP